MNKIRNKEEIVKEIQWFESGLSTIEEMLNETNLKLDKLHDELAEVEKLEKKKVWKPQEFKHYWCVDGDGDVRELVWEDDRTDNWNFSTNNCFKTEEEAKKRKFKIELESKARFFQLKNNKAINWEDSNSRKYYIYYDNNNKEVRLSLTFVGNDGAILGYFSSEELIKQFIEENKEDLTKYFEDK